MTLQFNFLLSDARNENGWKIYFSRNEFNLSKSMRQDKILALSVLAFLNFF